MYLRTQEICLKIYKLDPAKFLSAPELAWEAALKKAKKKLDLLTAIDMLLLVEKGIRGGMCHSIYGYRKNMIKIRNNDIFNIRMQIIYMVVQCHKSLQ